MFNSLLIASFQVWQASLGVWKWRVVLQVSLSARGRHWPRVQWHHDAGRLLERAWRALLGEGWHAKERERQSIRCPTHFTRLYRWNGRRRGSYWLLRNQHWCCQFHHAKELSLALWQVSYFSRFCWKTSLFSNYCKSGASSGPVSVLLPIMSMLLLLQIM